MIEKSKKSDLKYLYESIQENFGVKYKDNVFTNWLVYKINNKIVGFINYDSIYEKSEIEYIYVEKDFRNQGIATILLNEMIESLKKSNINSVTLEVNKDNIVAINFYKKNSFKEIAKRENYYGDKDAIVMIRNW